MRPGRTTSDGLRRPGPARAAALGVALALAALTTASCASDTPTRPESPRPAELDSVRETLADRRSDTQDLMETSLIRPTTEGAAPSGPGFGAGVVDFLGDVGNAAFDVLSMRALGIW